jgi:hypothetical protein
MQLSIRFLIVAVAVLFSLDAIACGDSMYRVGKGVSYRVYTAPLPGSVLVYGQSEGARQLAEALAQSGHGVRYVENETELESELSSGSYDVVIASYSEHDTVEARSAGATYLPVVDTRDQAKMVEDDYEKVMVANRDEIKHYLKAIHATLKKKT